MSFPLYDSIIRDIPKKDLTVKQKEELITKLEDIDDGGKELVYALIAYYFSVNDSVEPSDTLPYKAITSGSGKNTSVTWNLTDIPIKLRQMLHKFVVLHFKNKREEIDRCAP